MSSWIASGFAQNYRLIAALPLAYAIIVSGALVRRFPLRNDISYGMYIYAFPVQQLLATLGLVSLHPTVFFLVAAPVHHPTGRGQLVRRGETGDGAQAPEASAGGGGDI